MSFWVLVKVAWPLAGKGSINLPALFSSAAIAKPARWA